MEPDRSKQVLAGIREARRLRGVVDDKATPYASKYAAANALGALTAAADAAAQHEAAAHCRLERGLVLLETDLTGQGQAELEGALAFAWPASVAGLAAQQQGHNALGALCCSREQLDASLEHLRTAVQLYQQLVPLLEQRAAADASQSSGSDGDGSGSGRRRRSASWADALVDASQVEAEHTSSLYYLAQVHGHAGDRAASASYCAATLNRQLKHGVADMNEWVQNCCQLSGYFLDSNAFGLAHYCCKAVELALLQWHGKQQQQQQQQEQQQQPTTHAQPPAEPQEGACVHVAAAAPDKLQQQEGPDRQGKDQAAKQQQAGSKGGSGSSDSVGTEPPSQLQEALACLEGDVAANAQLAFAKRHLYCLVASHQRHVEGRPLSYTFCSAADVPGVLCFDALPGLPALDSLAWGDDALAADYGGALSLFRSSLPWFKRALAYYQLDGWVTEHVHTLFEMSNLYRCLAGFESDPHKRCVMHRSRAKLLAPLEGGLSPTHYPGLSRSISLELGHIFREIGDIKAAAARQQDKVAAAALASSRHYGTFLASFQEPGGAWPAKVEPEMEQHFLSGAFSMARVLQALHEDAAAAGGAPRLQAALGVLDMAAGYVEANHVDGWAEEARLARELAGLLRERAALAPRLAAAR